MKTKVKTNNNIKSDKNEKKKKMIMTTLTIS